MNPDVFLLMFPIFYFVACIALIAITAGVWLCSVEWRAWLDQRSSPSSSPSPPRAHSRPYLRRRT